MEYLGEVISFIGGLITGGALVTIRNQKQTKVGHHGTSVDQSKAKAGGDIVGGNKS